MVKILGLSSVLLWLIVLVVMIAMELVSLGLTTIWFAGGALVATVLAMFNAPFVVQVFAFLIVSVALLISTRPIAVRYFNKDRVRTNVESMIGQQAIVVGEINNLQGVGRVTIGGKEWSARTESDDITLPVGAVVIVKAISGVKLIVEERKEES